MRVKMSKQPPSAPTASAVGPCPTIIKPVGRPRTGSLPTTIAPPDHPNLTKGHSSSKKQSSLTSVKYDPLQVIGVSE